MSAKRKQKKLNYLTAYDHALPFVLLQPKFTPIRRIEEVMYNDGISRLQIQQLIARLKKSKTVALDYETKGVNIFSDDFEAVGIGLAGDDIRVYIANVNRQEWNFLHNHLANLDNMIAHNIMFDGAVFLREAKRHANWKGCTLALYKQLANEGFENQRWGLKSAQVDLMEWETTNEVDLDAWLIEHQYIKNGPKQKKNESDEDWNERYKMWVQTTDQKISVNKGEMWRAPAEILGKYCILDCEATYLLYEKHFQPVMNHFPEVQNYHQGIFLHLVYILIEQYMRGIQVDTDQLDKQQKHLEDHITRMRKLIREQEQMAPYISKYEEDKLQIHLDKEPTKHKKKPKLPKEPSKFKKNGEISKSWVNWLQRTKDINEMEPEVSKVWQNWNAKLHRIRGGEVKEFKFNIDSKVQLRTMLYGKEDIQGLVAWRHVRDHIAFDKFGGGQIGLIEVKKPNTDKWMELEMTKSGASPIDNMALKQMGDMGLLLSEYNSYTKELSYIKAYREMLNWNREGYYTIHPNFMAPGTLTGRLSSRNPNVQQMPKSEGTLSCFVSREGNVIVQHDHSALEQVVLAELSQDKSLLTLYGADAKANDVYLFTGSQTPVIGPMITKTGYDPFNPTPESIANAKKEAKKARSISKVLVLSSGYGAGANKIHKTLNLSGIEIAKEQVKQIHAKYWEIYSGVKKYASELTEIWRHNGGFLINDFGQPIAVDDMKKKDILNRMCQKTGHDIHMLWVQIFTTMLNDEGIWWKPFIIDWHDESMVECREEDKERVMEIMHVDSYKVLNDILGWGVKFRGDGILATNLAQAKMD